MSSVQSADPLSARPAGAWQSLLRPATVAAALAAALAGHAAAGAHLPAGAGGLAWILMAAAALGAGGGVLQAQAPGRAVAGLAGALLLGAVAAAAQVSMAAAAFAALAGALLVALHLGGDGHRLLGPLLSGLAFGLLFLLGAAGNPAALAAVAPAALAPVCYGAAFGIMRHGPLWCGDQRPALLAIGLLLVALLLPLGLGWFNDYAGMSALPFALVLAWWVLPDFLWGASDPRPLPVQTALTAGHLSAPALAAALAAGFGGLVAGLTLMLLVPLAGLLERVLGER
jgi:4-hydroxybenzoate polyprenyltransferase